MKWMTERDEKGRDTHMRFGDGTERWYDASGNLTHERWSYGDERWYDADGRVTKRKDKNGILHTN